MPATPTACLKAREAVSLQLDDELSELGSARLAAHLRRCERCSAYAQELAAVAAGLRAAPLEQPSAPVAMPAQWRRRAPWMPAAAAAAAVAALAAGSLLLGPIKHRPASLTVSPGRSASAQIDSAERWRQLLALIPPSDRRLIDLHATRWAA